ncbi:MAG: hypothetical protein WAV41_06090 [Microgenomates group bacterium]
MKKTKSKKVVHKVSSVAPKNNLTMLLGLLVISLVILIAVLMNMNRSLDTQSGATGRKNGYPTVPAIKIGGSKESDTRLRQGGTAGPKKSAATSTPAKREPTIKGKL